MELDHPLSASELPQHSQKDEAMTLQTALAQFAQSQITLDWDEWFALVLAAHKEPGQWRGAWARLDPADRKAFVALLRKDAGPLSDHILRSIVRNTPTDSDDPLLELACDDAADATDRQLKRLNELKIAAESDIQALSQVLETYTSIEELRSEEQRLREEIDQNPELAERHALEEHIRQLKTYRDSLLSRDRNERETEQRRLIEETELLKAEKDKLESEIRRARGERSAAKKELTEVQDEWNQEQAHLEELHTQIRDLEGRLEQTRAMTDDLTSFTNNLHSTLQQASSDLNTMSQKLKAIIGRKLPLPWPFRSGRG